MKAPVRTIGGSLLIGEDNRVICYDGRLSTFRQVVGGMVLPSGSKPGFAVVIGEDQVEDPLLRLLHKRVLAEVEDPDLHQFIKSCMEMNSIYSVDDWYGGLNDDRSVKIFENANRAQIIQLKRPLYNLPPPYLYGQESFKFYIDLIKDHLAPGREVLHFPDASILPRVVRNLPVEASHRHIVDYPPIAALAFGLASLYICRTVKSSSMPPREGTVALTDIGSRRMKAPAQPLAFQ